MLTNDAFRAMLNSQPAQADATPAEPEEPEQPQRTAADLWAEAPTQPPVPFDGSHGFGLLGSCGCFDIAAEHVDPDCDLCAQNPHADLWAESDELSERKVAQGLGIIRQSKTDSRRLRGDLVPLSLVKRVLDSTGRWDGVPERAAERAVALAKSARIAPNTWQLGRAQARRVPIHTQGCRTWYMGLQPPPRGAAAPWSAPAPSCTLPHPFATARWPPPPGLLLSHTVTLRPTLTTTLTLSLTLGLTPNPKPNPNPKPPTPLRAQEAAALLARLIEPSQRAGSPAPSCRQRRALLHAAALLHSAGRRCDNCGLPLDCCCFWPLTAGADAAASPGGRRLLCCTSCVSCYPHHYPYPYP